MITKSDYCFPFSVHSLEILSIQLRVPLETIMKYSQLLDGPEGRKIVHSFDKKIGNKNRTLVNSQEPFKVLNQKINELLQIISLPSEIKGGVLGESTISNASMHVGKNFLTKVDVKNYFPSIDSRMIKDLFLRLGCSGEVAKILTRLTTFEGALPQGFPTSASIANLYFAVHCYDSIKKIAEAKGYTFSLWIDDLAFSSTNPISFFDLQSVKKTIRCAGLEINTKKTKRFGVRDYKEVTGIKVNSRQRPKTEKIHEIENDLFKLRTISLDEVAKNKYPEKYQELIRKNRAPDKWMVEHVRGLLNYIKRIDEKDFTRIVSKHTEVLRQHQIF